MRESERERASDGERTKERKSETAKEWKKVILFIKAKEKKRKIRSIYFKKPIRCVILKM